MCSLKNELWLPKYARPTNTRVEEIEENYLCSTGTRNQTQDHFNFKSDVLPTLPLKPHCVKWMSDLSDSRANLAQISTCVDVPCLVSITRLSLKTDILDLNYYLPKSQKREISILFL